MKAPGQYLYFLQVDNKALFKIGITSDVDKRIESINKSLTSKKDSVSLITAIHTIQAKRKEKFLHNLFGCSRLTWKGSGKTEYFNLNWLEAVFVLLWFGWFKWRALIGFLIIAIVGGFLGLKYLGWL